MIIYLLKWALVLTLLYSMYGLTLRKETFHAFNRAVLWSIVVISAILPLLTFTVSHPVLINISAAKTEVYGKSLTTIQTIVPIKAIQSANEFNWGSLLKWSVTSLFYIVPFCLLFRYACSLTRVLKLIKQSKEVARVAHARVLINDQVLSPFSWMNKVVISTKDLQQNGRALLAHEMGHVQHAHSIDVLLLQIVCSLLWFCPFVWLLRADMRAVHEFQADANALNEGINLKAYGRLLVDKVTIPNSTMVANGINTSNLKRRLCMMYAKPSHRCAMIKVLFLLPLIVVTIVALARPEVLKQVAQAKRVADVVEIKIPQSLHQKTPLLTNEKKEKAVPTTANQTSNPLKSVAQMLKQNDDLAQLAKHLGVTEHLTPRVMVAAKTNEQSLHFFVDNKEVSRHEIEQYILIAPHKTEAGEVVAFARSEGPCNRLSISNDDKINRKVWGVGGCVIHVETPALNNGVIMGSDADDDATYFVH